MTPRDLVTSWRERADLLDRYAPPAAQAFRDAAEELDASLRDEADASLTLDQASRESGYTADHLRHLVAQGTIPNAGKKGAPRVRRADLPRRVKPTPSASYDPDADALRLLSKSA